MLEILETPHEIQDISDEKLHIHDGKIEFKEVNFHYVKENPVFQGLNLHIKPGEKVAIVGAS
jgi:ABC-type multidrug transport system fused ATPase/permease subunit